jgi:hypothetical protein
MGSKKFYNICMSCGACTLLVLSMCFVEARTQASNDPMYNKGYFEGDMDLRGMPLDAFAYDIYDESPGGPGKQPESRIQHAAIRGDTYRWSGGRVPYVIGAVSSGARTAIQQAINDYNRFTCIKWVPRSGERAYVEFINGRGCYSTVGRAGRRQAISLGRGCGRKATAIHEMMHALGFFHEQSRPDRDDYVKVQYDNIARDNWSQFRKYSVRMVDTQNIAYDYGSVMHYTPFAFSRNGQPSIVPNQRGATLGNRRGFSQSDIAKVNKLYGCPNGSGRRGTPAPVRPTRRPTRPVRPSVVVTGKCLDTSISCFVYVGQGKCKSDRKKMARTCPQSCGFCRRRGSGRKVGPPKPRKGRPGTRKGSRKGRRGSKRRCRNISRHCREATKYYGCSSDFIAYRCQRTCGLCSRGSRRGRSDSDGHFRRKFHR